DVAEVGIGPSAPGWLLLTVGVTGFWQSRGKGERMRFLPLVAMMIIYVFSRPGFDLMRWMPWFKFTRVISRATVVYSVILSLFAVGLTWPLKRAWLAIVGIVGSLELFTFAQIKMNHPAFAFDDH